MVPWRARDALWVFLLSGIVGALVFSLGKGPELGPAVWLLTSGLLGALSLLWVAPRNRHNIRLLLAPAPRIRWHRGVGRGIGLGLVLLVVQVVVFVLVDELLGIPAHDEPATEVAVAEGGAIAALVALVLLTPVSEEIFFRGLLYQGLRRWLGIGKATWVSAIFFGLLHLTPSLVGSLASITTGVLFGYFMARSFERWGTLLVPVVAHATNNLLATLAALSLDP